MSDKHRIVLIHAKQPQANGDVFSAGALRDIDVSKIPRGIRWGTEICNDCQSNPQLKDGELIANLNFCEKHGLHRRLHITPGISLGNGSVTIFCQ